MNMEEFKWKIGKWLCEVEDTTRGPLCTCWIRVSSTTVKEWDKFSKKIGKAFKSHHTITKTEPELKGRVIALTMAYKDIVPTTIMFAEAKQHIEQFEQLAAEHGVKFEELNNK